MKIESLELCNFRGVRKMTLQFSEGVTVLAGINGAGKSSVLDALAILLSWGANRIGSHRASGRPIAPLDINNRASFSQITLQCTHDPTGYLWSLVKYRKGHQGEHRSYLSAASSFADAIREQITETDERCSIPLMAYYPVGRVVLDIPLRIRKKHSFDLLNAFEGALTSGANFRTFFEWFRNREDLENENLKWKDDPRTLGDSEFPDRQLEAVRQALSVLLPEFSGLSVRRDPLRMVVYKSGEELQIGQLSDGEKCLIAMVGDLARRLAIANPTLDEPLTGDGVVLIDEIDLHLHPSWQRMVVPRLREAFPNCQFVISTHSPQVLGEVEGRDIRRLYQDEEAGIVFHVPTQAKGLDSSGVLEELMGAKRRNEDIAQRIRDVFQLIDSDQLVEAKERIAELEADLHGSIPELTEANTLVEMLKEDPQVAGE